MILIQDLIMLMRNGFSHDGISFGMTIEELNNRLGSPDSVIGDSKMGYFMYNPLRIGYFNNIVNEIAILFDNEHDFRFNLILENLEEGFDIIQKETKIYELIKIFNNNGVIWDAQYRKNELDYVSISVEKGSEVLFDLDTGCINRIGFNPAG